MTYDKKGNSIKTFVRVVRDNLLNILHRLKNERDQMRECGIYEFQFCPSEYELCSLFYTNAHPTQTIEENVRSRLFTLCTFHIQNLFQLHNS